MFVMVRNDDPALHGLPRTGRDCHVCGDGEFLKDGSELICDTCQYTPDNSEHTDTTGPWERFREWRRDEDDRTPCVGGVPDAYWGDDEYEYSPRGGFQHPR